MRSSDTVKKELLTATHLTLASIVPDDFVGFTLGGFLAKSWSQKMCEVRRHSSNISTQLVDELVPPTHAGRPRLMANDYNDRWIVSGSNSHHLIR